MEQYNCIIDDIRDIYYTYRDEMNDGWNVIPGLIDDIFNYYEENLRGLDVSIKGKDPRSFFFCNENAFGVGYYGGYNPDLEAIDMLMIRCSVRDRYIMYGSRFFTSIDVGETIYLHNCYLLLGERSYFFYIPGLGRVNGELYNDDDVDLVDQYLKQLSSQLTVSDGRYEVEYITNRWLHEVIDPQEDSHLLLNVLIRGFKTEELTRKPFGIKTDYSNLEEMMSE